ncbi:FAD binding domain-containing protein [Streptomyces sp. 2112.3]|uniref:FAD-binding oxidoreductase n=1 Tax=Streptomyces sp. 2112.3 TaxID=1881023 RepID=UPI0008965E87|nr:FAD-binding oxidoreductase [Streptomyces sp. 2112.3]SEE53163.1 FAD binding domain-containing protein [Streptomyces sp. 2112.3]
MEINDPARTHHAAPHADGDIHGHAHADVQAHANAHTLDPAALPALVRETRGPVLVPGDDGYDAERSGFQRAYRHRPAVIVGAECAGDVVAAVRFARVQGLPVAVQATGHGLSAATDGGLLISTRRMTGVRVDAAAGTARVEAGAVWGQVVEAAAPYGLAPLNGSSPGVGVISYTLGGGVGVLARTYGFAADHVRSVDLVTADARLRHVTAKTDPGLFRALLGGGHGLGVVTAMEFGLVPVARLYGGQLVFGGEQIDAALAAYLDWTATVPDELTSSLALIAYPDLPQLPDALRGRYLAHIRIAYTGSAAEGERLVAPLRAVGPRVSDDLREMPYAESHTIHRDPSDPHAYDGDNALLSGLDAAALQRVAALTGPAAPVMCVVQLNHLGGAMAKPGGPDGAAGSVGHRDAGFALRLLSPLTERAEESPGAPDTRCSDGRPDAALATVRGLHAEALAAVAPWRLGRSVNFLFGGHGERPDAEEVARSVHEADAHRRLAGLKARHDPANVFRFHPAGALTAGRTPVAASLSG